jgi:hypothetical protein
MLFTRAMHAARARGRGTDEAARPRGVTRGAAGGRDWKERRRERRGKTEREGGGAHLGAWTIAATAHRITPRAKEVEERWERGGREIGGGCCAGKTNEIEREGRGEHGGAPGARGQGQAETEAHNTRDHRSETTRESKSETRRDKHAIKHDIRQKKYASA